MAPKLSKSVEDYIELDEIDHLLLRPDSLAGSKQPVTKPNRVYSMETHRFEKTDVRSCDALERTFLEVLSNAADNCISTLSLHEDNPGRKSMISSRAPISVTVTNRTVTVTNIGDPIPLLPRKESTPDAPIYVPALIFGRMRAGINLDDSVSRAGAGRNGYGAKVTNVFSTEFRVKIGDPTNGQEATYVWRNNMRDLAVCEILPGHRFENGAWVTNGDATRGKRKVYKGREYVEVSYDIDFSRFGEIAEYDANLIALFARYVAEYTFTIKIPIQFNGVTLDLRTSKAFVQACVPDAEGRAIVHYEWANAKDAEKAASLGRDAIVKAIGKGELSLPAAEIVYFDAPHGAVDYGFVNGLFVPTGLHLNEAVSRAVAAIIAASPKATAAAKGGSAFSIKPADVRNYFSTVVSVHVPNPTFSSQTKQEFTSPPVRFPGVDASLFRAALTSANKWSVALRIEDAIEQRERRAIKKTDGRKRKRTDVDGLTDANDAGGPNSLECTIFITEGTSAGIYASTRTDHLAGSQDRFGMYPIRGKFINVRKEAIATILKNQEFCDVKKAIGLENGVDYSTPEALATLRYGRVCILADADEDGSAIRSLLINCFAFFWPSFVAAGRLAYLATPAIRVVDAKSDEIVKRFYTDSAFNRWAAAEGAAMMRSARYRARHIKGLSTSSNRDVKDDVETAPTLHIVYSPDDEEALDLAFSKKRADDRKRWIMEWRLRCGETVDIFADVDEPKVKGRKRVPKVMHRTVRSIIDSDLAEYSFGSLRRSIPMCADGLKHSQRQAVWAALRVWNYGESSAKSMKVSRFAASVAESTMYAHGETSMQECVVNLAQGFTGSNNIPILAPDGQFGSRAGGTKLHGAARYLYTKTNWAVPYLFMKTAVDLIPREQVEGEQAESQWLPCDISLAVVNGAAGVATGWSTTIPCHHPIETVNWYLDRIGGRPPTDPTVWFVGSDAENEVVKRAGPEGETSGRCFVSKGVFRILRHPSAKDPTYDVAIDELPVGLWTSKYLEFLNGLIFSGRLFEFRNMSKTHSPKFELYRLSTIPLSKEEKATAKEQKPKAKAAKAAKPKPAKAAKMAEVAVTAETESLPPLTHEFLQLVTIQPLTNFFLLQRDGCPKKYAVVGEILEDHYQEMCVVYEKVKVAWLEEIRAALAGAEERYALIHAIVEEKLIVFKRPKKDILDDIKRMKLSSDQFATLKMEDATAEELAKLRAKIDDLRARFESINATPHLEFWRERLEKFRTELVRRIRAGTTDGSDGKASE